MRNDNRWHDYHSEQQRDTAIVCRLTGYVQRHFRREAGKRKQEMTELLGKRIQAQRKAQIRYPQDAGDSEQHQRPKQDQHDTPTRSAGQYQIFVHH